jgi:uncharacterized membrane protein
MGIKSAGNVVAFVFIAMIATWTLAPIGAMAIMDAFGHPINYFQGIGVVAFIYAVFSTIKAQAS